ncbi:uncharacterized protein LOC142992706 isoform X3 [Genypterus blacodes]|uniref:uncharacterized protein LOC142992706 isoform X3 n=1 Tax=Genypterus blacodes TaxID=154954 RepID=UPI003F75CA0F
MGAQCSTSPKTVDCLYDIASSHAGLVPDTSLDSSLASLLSINSSQALVHQYSTLQSQMTRQQRFDFNRDLHTTFGRNSTVPGAANDRVKMTELLEIYEGKLRLELKDFYDRMMFVDGRALSTDGVKQWMNGAALHIHTFLHWKRLTDPSASEDLSLHYLHGLDPLVKSYEDYLLGTVKVFSASSRNPRGMLIVEPQRNVSHEVRHRVCESKAIQQALVERFLSDQDLRTGKEFFQSSHNHHDALMAQRARFQLSMGRVWKH